MQAILQQRTASTLRSDDIDGARPNKFKHSKRGYYYDLKSPYIDQPTAPADTSSFIKSPLEPHDLYQPAKVTGKITHASPLEPHDIYHPAKVTGKITHSPTLSPERSGVDNHYANISKIASGTGLNNSNPQTARRFQSQEPRQSNTYVPVPPDYNIDSMRNPMYADHNYSQSRSFSQSPFPAPTNEYEKNKLLLQSGQPQNHQQNQYHEQNRQSNLLRNSTNGVGGHGLSNIITNNNPSNYMVNSPSKFGGSQTPNAQNNLRDSVDHLKRHVEASTHTPNHNSSKVLPDLTPIKKDLHKFYGVTPPPSRHGEYYKGIQYEKPNNPPEQMRESFYNNMTRRVHYKASEDPQFKKALNKFFNSPITQQESYQINRDAFYRGYTPIVGQQKKFVGVSLNNQKPVNRYGDPIQEKSYELEPISQNKSGIRFAQSPGREPVYHGDPRYQASQQRSYY